MNYSVLNINSDFVIMELNLEDSVQHRQYVDKVDYDENGHRVVVGQMDLFAHKECPCLKL